MIPLGVLAAATPRASGGAVDPLAVSILAKLTSWWEMSEASGTRYDSKGSSHLAVDSGSVNTATGVRGSGDVSANFVPNSNLTVDSTGVRVSSGGGDHCLFGWFYLTSNAGVQGIATKTSGTGSSTLEYAISVQSSVCYGQNGGSAYYNASQSAPSTGAWHFAVLWRDSADGKVRLQIDNGTVNVSSAESNPSPQANKLAFGSNGAGNYMKGRLQRWGWIKGAILTADERTFLYNSGSSRKYSEIIAASGV